MTNQVETAAAAASGVGSQACDVFSREFSRGQEFIEQAWAWIMEHGMEFIGNIVMALLILALGGIVVKLITMLVRKALRKTKRVNKETADNAIEHVEHLF